MTETVHHTVLHAFYDLSVSPLSFDFLTYLVEAERTRREKYLDYLHLVFVPQSVDRQHPERLFAETHGSWRMHNLLIPSCWLLPSCKNVTLCNSREEAELVLKNLATHVFPAKYTVDKPLAHHHTGWPIISGHLGKNIQFLEASEQARAYARQWLGEHAKGKKAVALTLREATFTPKRNSDVAEWFKFAHLLKENGFFPVILRDIETALDSPSPEFEGTAMFPEGVFNLELRMALYQECHISAFVSNGPSTPCYYCRDARYLYFVTGEWLHDTPPLFNRIGLAHGQTPPFANHYQRWLWSGQDADRFMEEVNKLDEFIEEKKGSGTYDDYLDPISDNREPMMTVVRRFFDWLEEVGEPAKALQQGDWTGKALQQGDWTEPELRLALYCYRRAPQEEKTKYENMLMRARIHLRLQEPHMALAISKYVPDMPDPNGEYIDFGQALSAGGHHDLARQLFLDALHLGLETAEIVFHLGILEQALGYTENAIRRFQRLIEQNVPTSAVYIQLGELYETNGRQDLALEVYDLADAKGFGSPEIEKRRLSMNLAEKFQ